MFRYLLLCIFTSFLTQLYGEPFGYFSNTTASGTVRVVDLATNQIVATVSVGANPIRSSVTNDRAFVYVPNLNSDSISVIDTSTNTVVATISTDLGNGPRTIAISPDDAFAYVAVSNDNEVAVINLSTNTVIDNISVGADPRTITITPDGAFVYVTNLDSDTVSVIDTSTNTVTDTISTGDQPFGIDVAPDGAFVYITARGDDEVEVISTATNTIVASAPTGDGPIQVAVSPDGTVAYAVNSAPASYNVSVIDTATNTNIATIAIGDGPIGVAFSPNGENAYIGERFNNSVSVIEVSSHTVVDQIALTGTNSWVGTPAPLSPNPPPETMSAFGVQKNNVFLTQIDIYNVIQWTGLSAPPEEYQIIRNGVLLQTVSGQRKTIYEDHNVKKNQRNTYTVKAFTNGVLIATAQTVVQ